MFKINEKQFIEGKDFFNRVFRSEFHACWDGCQPALEDWNIFGKRAGAKSVRYSSHVFQNYTLNKEKELDRLFNLYTTAEAKAIKLASEQQSPIWGYLLKRKKEESIPLSLFEIWDLELNGRLPENIGQVLRKVTDVWEQYVALSQLPE